MFDIDQEYSQTEEENTKNGMNNTNELLNTIKVPQNLAQLTKRLPKSNYEVARQNTHSNSIKSRDGLSSSYNIDNGSQFNKANTVKSRLNKYKNNNA